MVSSARRPLTIKGFQALNDKAQNEVRKGTVYGKEDAHYFLAYIDSMQTMQGVIALRGFILEDYGPQVRKDENGVIQSLPKFWTAIVANTRYSLYGRYFMNDTKVSRMRFMDEVVNDNHLKVVYHVIDSVNLERAIMRRHAEDPQYLEEFLKKDRRKYHKLFSEGFAILVKSPGEVHYTTHTIEYSRGKHKIKTPWTFTSSKKPLKYYPMAWIEETAFDMVQGII